MNVSFRTLYCRHCSEQGFHSIQQVSHCFTKNHGNGQTICVFPPIFSIFILADSENACAEIFSFFVTFPLPSTLLMPISAVLITMASPSFFAIPCARSEGIISVSYTHLRAHETDSYLVC